MAVLFFEFDHEPVPAAFDSSGVEKPHPNCFCDGVRPVCGVEFFRGKNHIVIYSVLGQCSDL